MTTWGIKDHRVANSKEGKHIHTLLPTPQSTTIKKTKQNRNQQLLVTDKSQYQWAQFSNQNNTD